MKSRPSILYVDDEEPHLDLFQAVFESDYEIHTALSATAAIEVLGREEIQVLITDQRMPGMTGVELLAAIRDDYPDLGRMIRALPNRVFLHDAMCLARLPLKDTPGQARQS